MFEKNYMFKMCFKIHRIQKNIFKNTLFFLSTMKIWGVELCNFFDGPKKKKVEKIICLKSVLRTI